VVDFVTANDLSFVEGLVRLTGHEIDFKEASRTATLIRQGAFPHRKEVRDFDFDFQPSVNRQQILDFETLRFVEKRENIVFLGPSGVGKSHLATAIGIAAAKKRQTAYFIKSHDLVLQLRRARMENRLADRLKHFSKYSVLVIDELGYLPIDKEDSKPLFQLIDMRYEKKSTVITTNINFNAWDEIFHDPVIANAILDRILHHAHVVTISGRSYRMKDHVRQGEEDG
jgi:DNA replication protein DnaC